ncbi:MAG: rhombosortase [Planctomycetes bacterium]|nr:rhombosortase [Planctomycetota bacterium]
MPCVSLLLTLAALAVFLWPGLGETLEYRREAILAGEWWRLLTGHLTHTSLTNLAWNAGAFLALGAVCERVDRARFRLALAAALAAVPLALIAFSPTTEAYRGLSGADSALFALLVLATVRHSLGDGRPAAALLVAAAGAAFFLKVGYEALLGRALFAVDASGFVPLPVAHLVGAAAGLAAAFLPGRRFPSSSRACTQPPGPKHANRAFDPRLLHRASRHLTNHPPLAPVAKTHCLPRIVATSRPHSNRDPSRAARAPWHNPTAAIALAFLLCPSAQSHVLTLLAEPDVPTSALEPVQQSILIAPNPAGGYDVLLTHGDLHADASAEDVDAAVRSMLRVLRGHPVIPLGCGRPDLDLSEAEPAAPPDRLSPSRKPALRWLSCSFLCDASGSRSLQQHLVVQDLPAFLQLLCNAMLRPETAGDHRAPRAPPRHGPAARCGVLAGDASITITLHPDAGADLHRLGTLLRSGVTSAGRVPAQTTTRATVAVNETGREIDLVFRADSWPLGWAFTYERRTPARPVAAALLLAGYHASGEPAVAEEGALRPWESALRDGVPAEVGVRLPLVVSNRWVIYGTSYTTCLRLHAWLLDQAARFEAVTEAAVPSGIVVQREAGEAGSNDLGELKTALSSWWARRSGEDHRAPLAFFGATAGRPGAYCAGRGGAYFGQSSMCAVELKSTRPGAKLRDGQVAWLGVFANETSFEADFDVWQVGERRRLLDEVDVQHGMGRSLYVRSLLPWWSRVTGEYGRLDLQLMEIQRRYVFWTVMSRLACHVDQRDDCRVGLANVSESLRRDWMALYQSRPVGIPP